MDSLKSGKRQIHEISRYIQGTFRVKSAEADLYAEGSSEYVDVPSMSDVVIPILVKYISKSGLKPGDKLPPEKSLERIVGVSNRPLREALTILRSVGIVKSRPGKGWYVGRFDPTHSLRFLSPLLESMDGLNLEQIIDSRLSIEPIVARYAARNISESGITRLQNAYQEMLEYAQDDSKDEFRQKDRFFHEVLAQECQHPIMAMLSSIMNGLFQSQLYLQTTANYKPILEQHKRILDGIQNHNTDHAEAAMIEHIQKSHEFLKSILYEEAVSH